MFVFLAFNLNRDHRYSETNLHKFKLLLELLILVNSKNLFDTISE
jgi:hypothetical protein